MNVVISKGVLHPRDLQNRIFLELVMSHLDVSIKWSIVKTSNKRWNCFLAYKMLTKITYLFCQNCSKLMKMCVLPMAQRGAAPLPPYLPRGTLADGILPRIRSTSIAYADCRFKSPAFWHKSAARASYLLTFASSRLHRHRKCWLSLQCRFKSAAQGSHMFTFSSSPPWLRTQTPSAAVWAKPPWITLISWLLSYICQCWIQRFFTT